MGWCTTFDLDRFVAAAGGYLRSTAVENTLLLSAVAAARCGRDPRIAGRPPVAAAGPGQARPDLLFGWWEPPDGSEPRGAFLHDPAAPLLIAGRAPEMAAALAGTLAKTGRPVSGVDGPIEAADAFAAAWSHREGASVRMHKQCRVYRLVAGGAGGIGAAGETGSAGGSGAAFPAEPGFLSEPARSGSAAGRAVSGPAGRFRVASRADRALIADWLTACAIEVGERIGSAQDLADDLISYGGAVLWESPHRPGYQPVAMAGLTRPIAGTVRISVVYTRPDRRRNGYAAAVTFAASRAAIEGIAPGAEPGTGPTAGSQVVMITDRNRPDRRVARLGYQLVGERAVLRFGPPTGPLQRLRTTGPMPRFPTGPLPRFRR